MRLSLEWASLLAPARLRQRLQAGRLTESSLERGRRRWSYSIITLRTPGLVSMRPSTPWAARYCSTSCTLRRRKRGMYVSL